MSSHSVPTVPLNERLARRRPLGRVDHMPSSHDFVSGILSGVARHLPQIEIKMGCLLTRASGVHAARMYR
jgi:hypothetical protein